MRLWAHFYSNHHVPWIILHYQGLRCLFLRSLLHCFHLPGTWPLSSIPTPSTSSFRTHFFSFLWPYHDLCASFPQSPACFPLRVLLFCWLVNALVLLNQYPASNSNWSTIQLSSFMEMICKCIYFLPSFQFIYPDAYLTSLLGCLICISN